MSVKKLLVLTAASLVAIGATAVMAGGPDHMAMPAEPAFQNSIYIDGHVGYAQVDWKNFNSNNVMGASGSSVYKPNSNGMGGWTGAVDLGYNITQNIAAEAGWFYLPQVKGNYVGGVAVPGAIGSTGTVNSWFAYMAAKLSVPVMQDLDLFGKVGVAYRSVKYSTPTVTSGAGATAFNQATGNGAYWAPMFATGLQYFFGNWSVGAQYTYLPGHTDVNYGAPAYGAPNAAPQANLYTAFLGYKFNV